MMRGFLLLIIFTICHSTYGAKLIPLENISARDISGDGKTVVGMEISPSGALLNGIARWNLTQGTHIVTNLDSGAALVTGVSYSGDAITLFEQTATEAKPQVWKEGVGLISLEKSSTASRDTPRDISGDGSTIVGQSLTPCCEAYKWDAEGNIENLNLATPVPPSNISSYGVASSISSDGNTISYLNTQGAYLRVGSTDYLIHPFESLAPPSKVSANGEYVVGQYQGVAYRYSIAGGFESLGLLPDPPGTPLEELETESQALDVSADGRVVVGFSRNAQDETEAFIWEESIGIQSLEAKLQSEGIMPENWQHIEVVAVSDNGLVLIGNATNAEGNFQSFLVDFTIEEHVPLDSIYTLMLLMALLLLITKMASFRTPQL